MVKYFWCVSDDVWECDWHVEQLAVSGKLLSSDQPNHKKDRSIWEDYIWPSSTELLGDPSTWVEPQPWLTGLPASGWMKAYGEISQPLIAWAYSSQHSLCMLVLLRSEPSLVSNWDTQGTEGTVRGKSGQRCPTGRSEDPRCCAMHARESVISQVPSMGYLWYKPPSAM